MYTYIKLSHGTFSVSHNFIFKLFVNKVEKKEGKEKGKKTKKEGNILWRSELNFPFLKGKFRHDITL